MKDLFTLNTAPYNGFISALVYKGEYYLMALKGASFSYPPASFINPAGNELFEGLYKLDGNAVILFAIQGNVTDALPFIEEGNKYVFQAHAAGVGMVSLSDGMVVQVKTKVNHVIIDMYQTNEVIKNFNTELWLHKGYIKNTYTITDQQGNTRTKDSEPIEEEISPEEIANQAGGRIGKPQKSNLLLFAVLGVAAYLILK